MTVLPLSLGASLRDHLGRVKTLHEADLAAGYGEVYLPDAPARKYPGAPRQWAWQGGRGMVSPLDGVGS